MRRWGWYASRHDNRITGRLYRLAVDRHPWWDWGHRVMILTGTCVGGNYDEPHPTTWYYRRNTSRPMWRTKYPRWPRRAFTVITDYTAFGTATDGINEDQLHDWQAINLNQDGELQLGHQYWGGGFYGLRPDEWWLLRKYLRRAHRHNWWGLRSWLYHQALHSAVHQRKPFACNATPAAGSGGYSHWHCRLRRHHPGAHRTGNYEWYASGRVRHVPDHPGGDR